MLIPHLSLILYIFRPYSTLLILSLPSQCTLGTCAENKRTQKESDKTIQNKINDSKRIYPYLYCVNSSYTYLYKG